MQIILLVYYYIIKGINLIYNRRSLEWLYRACTTLTEATMESPYQPEPLFKQAHALFRWVLPLHSKTRYLLPRQSPLRLVLAIPQQPCFQVTR